MEYLEYKWRRQSRQRKIIFPLFSVVLLLGYLMLYYETSTTGYFHVVSAMAIVFLFIHSVCTLLTFSNYLYSESLQYKRLCECAVFSTLIIFTLLVIVIVNVQQEKYSNLFHSGLTARLITYLIIYSFLSSQMFHLMGMPHNTTGLLFTWSSVSWIVVLIYLSYDFVYIIFIISVLFSSLFVNVCQENDSRISYEDKYINQSREILKSNSGDNYNVAGIIPCLYMLNETIKDSYTTLTNDGVIEANIDETSWQWDRTLALLHNSQMLSNSISSVFVKMYKAPVMPNEFYSLGQLVSRLLGMFESIYRHNLALFFDFTNVKAAQRYISGHKDALELVLFLIMQSIFTYGFNETIKQYPVIFIQYNQVDHLNSITFHVISLDNRKNEMFTDSVHKDSVLEMSPLLQLANKVASMYLGCIIDCTEPKYNAGVKEVVINIPLNSPEITIATKVMGASIELESSINPTWLFIEDQKSSSMSMDILKAKFNLLRVPVTQSLAHNLVKIIEKYSVALISEDLLVKHLDQFKSHLGDIALHLVVVCKNPSSPSDIFSNYKLKVSACLSIDSMVNDVYNCIMYLCAKQLPRVIVGSDDFSVFFNNHLSGFTSPWKNSDSLNNNSSSFLRQNDVKAYKKIRMIKPLVNHLLCNKLMIVCNKFVSEIQVHLPYSPQQLLLINHIIEECKERIHRIDTDVSVYDEDRNKYLLNLVEKTLDSSENNSPPSIGETSDNNSIYFLLPSEHTRVAFYIYNTFVPVIISIKEKLYRIQSSGKLGDVAEYVSIKSTLVAYSARANACKLQLLNTLLLTLHDLVTIMHTLMSNISDESQSSHLLTINQLLIQECQVTELYLVTYIENSI